MNFRAQQYLQQSASYERLFLYYKFTALNTMNSSGFEPIHTDSNALNSRSLDHLGYSLVFGPNELFEICFAFAYYRMIKMSFECLHVYTLQLRCLMLIALLKDITLF